MRFFRRLIHRLILKPPTAPQAHGPITSYCLQLLCAQPPTRSDEDLHFPHCGVGIMIGTPRTRAPACQLSVAQSSQCSCQAGDEEGERKRRSCLLAGHCANEDVHTCSNGGANACGERIVKNPIEISFHTRYKLPSTFNVQIVVRFERLRLR